MNKQKSKKYCIVLFFAHDQIILHFRLCITTGFTMYTTCVIWLAFVPIVLLNTEKVPLKVSENENQGPDYLQ